MEVERQALRQEAAQAASAQAAAQDRCLSLWRSLASCCSRALGCKACPEGHALRGSGERGWVSGPEQILCMSHAAIRAAAPAETSIKLRHLCP